MKNKLKRNNIKVLVRCRPLLQFQNQPAWQISSQNKIQCMYTKSVKNKIDKSNRRTQTDIEQKLKDLHFQFEKIFDDNITSQKIYKQQAKQMVKQALNQSHNLTLMCYGQTCSGKTFTILGQQKFPGLMPCVLRDLTIYKRQNNFSCNIKMSYFQIYNQHIYDLLVDNGGRKHQHKLKVSEDKQFGWEVVGLKKQNVITFQDCIKIIQKGQKNRAYASKQNHDRSSRSHTIMRIYIQKEDKRYNQINQIFNIVDLAGSQRLSQSSTNAQQTASINKSLFQLSNVISKLASISSNSSQKLTHIPYRDSKLTKLLECSLNGKSNCIIMFCISPAVQSFQQTLSTLRLAKKAKNIQTEVDIYEQNMMRNWSPVQRQLFETKQRLSKKTIQCEQLTDRLDYLSRQLQKLQRLFEQMENKSSINLNVSILLDHQNFIIKNEQSNEILNQKSQPIFGQIEEIKKDFECRLSELYQDYASDICSVYVQRVLQNNKIQKSNQKNRSKSNRKNKVQFSIDPTLPDKYTINIQKLCFMDMVFNNQSIDIPNQSHLLINKLKVNSIQNLLQDLYNNQDSNKQNKIINSLKTYQRNKDQNTIKNQFIQLLQVYKYQLNQQIESNPFCYNNQNTIGSGKFPNKSNIIQTERNNKAYSSSANYNNTNKKNIKQPLNQTKKKKQQNYTQSQLFNSNIQYIDSSILLPSSPYQIKSQNPSQKLIFNQRKQIQSYLGINIYTWGCSKDGRIFKGNSVINGITMMNTTQNYGSIKAIKTNYNHAMIINQNGQIYAWGKNNYHQITAKNTPAYSIPKQIKIPQKIKSIATGWGHSLALSQNGRSYSWGYGQNGQLGHGNFQNLQKPTLIETKIKYKQIFAGHSHSGLLDQQGNLYTFGFNKDYRCMIKSQNSNINKPTKILANKIKFVSLGLSHSAVITEQNFVFCGGVGTNGQFAKQLTNQVSGCQFICVQNRKFQDQLNKYEKVCPFTQFEPIYQDQNQFIIDIKCGQNSTYYLTNAGNLYLCGKSFNKKNCQNIYNSKLLLRQVYSFSIGSRHGFAFSLNSNKIYGWGFNMYNQLGNSKQSDLLEPQVIPCLSNLNIYAIQCGFIHSVGLSK